jgi:hypothetical protein
MHGLQHTVTMLNTKQPELKMQQVTPDFRRSQLLAGTLNGKAINYRVCEELVAGRWEGFVAIVPAK